MALQARLSQALTLPQASKTQSWAPVDAPMAHALRKTVDALGIDRDTRPPNDAMVEAVQAFWRDRQIKNFNQLKYICYGLAVPVDRAGNRLIDRAPLFERVLELVDERRAQPKPFRRCFQGLLAGYFGCERRGKASDVAGTNWLRLREFLGSRLTEVEASTGKLAEPPTWLTTLLAHPNLLQDKPCARYAAALRRGDTTELKKVCGALNIEASSWVWHEAVLAYVMDMVEDTDSPFKADLRRALDMIQAREKDRRLPDAVAKATSALLVMRYARCQDKPENPILRDTCIERIGNPWLDRAAWDGAVGDEDARRMVESWLKRGLIRDFFQLLSHEGRADARRLEYWLKWEPHITEMWFALGGGVRNSIDPELTALRKRMQGRERALTGSTSGNTAFIMRIGPLMVIEFGEKGNACYVMRFDDFAGDLEEMRQNIHQLRQGINAIAMRHDGPWELAFDQSLRRRLNQRAGSAGLALGERLEHRDTKASSRTGDRPGEHRATDISAPPRSTRPNSIGSRAASTADAGQAALLAKVALEREIRQLASLNQLQIDDRRPRGGALWLVPRRVDDVDTGARARLREIGFRFAPGRGFYLEGDD